MRKYEIPKILIASFETEDIVTASKDTLEGIADKSGVYYDVIEFQDAPGVLNYNN